MNLCEAKDESQYSLLNLSLQYYSQINYYDLGSDYIMVHNPPQNPVFRYGILIGIYWLTYNTMLLFANMLYKSNGLGNYEIGIASTCTALSNVLAQPIWGLICDRMPKIKKVFAIGLVGAMLATTLQFINTGGEWLIVLSMCLVNFCYFPMSSLLDAWINRMNANGMSINYGPARAFGSVGGVIASLLFGFLIDRFGVIIMAPCFIFCCVVLLVYVFSLYEPKAEIAARKKNVDTEGETFQAVLKKLVTNKQYLFLIFTYMLSYAALSGVNTFLSVKVTDLGGGFLEFGTISAITAGCEIIFLVFLPRITRFIRPQGIIMIGFFFVTIRIVGLSFANSLPMIWLVSTLHGPSYGIMIGGVVAYLSAVVDHKSLFSAQTGFAAASGIGQILGSYLGGILSSAYSVDTMILMMAVLPAVSFTVMAFNFFTVRRENMMV